jgi:ATP-binding cassette subfamily B protein
MHFFRTMIRYLSPYKLLGLLFTLGILVEVAYAMFAPLSLKYMIDEAFTPKDEQMFLLIISVLIGGGFLSVAAGTAGDYAISKISGGIIYTIRTQLYAHMQKQSLDFFSKYRMGDIVTRFTSDMSSIERVLASSLPFGLKEGLGVIVGLILLLQLEWKLTLAMVVGSALIFIGPRLLQKRAEEVNLKLKEEQERFTNTIDESLKGQKTIKGMHLQGLMLKRAQAQIQALFTLGLRRSMTNSFIERFPLTGLMLLNGIMIGFGGYLIFQDQLSIGSFIAFFTLFMSVGQAVTNLTYVLPNLFESMISFKRIFDMLELRPTVEEAKQPKQLPTLSNEIRFHKVKFGYTDDVHILKHVELTIPIGSYTAFVGPSGSGKSTAMQLLLRFYDPNEGTILLDGIDLRTVSEKSLREQMSIVFQETFLFNTTIRENLLMGNPAATEEDMLEAAKAARIDETITKWPDGFDTLIHNEGASLSGGQRQRISIARALLRKPTMLLLDEVTSALDPATEAEINESILTLKQDRTVISVTHRLASVTHADRIVVFNEGQVVEEGSHEQLLDMNGLYKQMWDKQHGFTLSSDGFHAKVDGERLGKLPFFQGMEQEPLESISTLFTTERYVPGQAIVMEGDEGDKFYIIVRGSVEITKNFTPEQATKLAVLQDGDHFGEIALLKDIPRTASVTAIEPTIVLSLRREGFLELTAKYPQMRQTLESTLLERMK